MSRYPQKLIRKPSISQAAVKAALPTNVVGSAIFTFAFVVAAAIVGLGALLALSSNEQRAVAAFPVLLINFAVIVALGVYLSLRVWRVLFSSKAGDTAPQLHRRFVLIFSLTAMLPAIIVGVFFGAVVSQDVSDWYDDNVGIVVEDAKNISASYVRGEVLKIRPDIYAMSDDLNRQTDLLTDRITYSAYLIQQAVFREVPILYIVDSTGQVIAKAESQSAPVYLPPTEDMYTQATNGTLTMDLRESADLLLILNKLENYDDAFLYTGKFMEPGVISALTRFDRVESSLARLTTGQGQINNVFLLTYIQAALLILMAAIWLGLVLANFIVKPLGQMVLAAEKVRSGDLSTRVNVDSGWDEISDLASAFNRMTSQLGSQREDLVREHDVSEQRRQFSEAVLSGVSAGIIGLSPSGRITLINNSAENLLGLKSSDVVGRPLTSVLPDFAPAYLAAREAVQRVYEDQVDIDMGTGTRNFDVRVSVYRGERADTGWVMTFDDMTRLVAAQRHSAWRDVARRIAHEIKNPLTPIQLSAERLERKYGKEITSDPETFHSLTQTIQRQVLSLGNMVDEFSAFARMPAPVRQQVNFHELLDTSVFTQRVAFPSISFTVSTQDSENAHIFCDERLIGQALMNVLKNSGESITSRLDEAGLQSNSGKVDVVITDDNATMTVTVQDNGKGWPLQDKDRLLEPYVTTRDKGTGLGLAIVNRIIEDHGGSLELTDRSDGGVGACVVFKFPLSNIATRQSRLAANDRPKETHSSSGSELSASKLAE